MPQLENRSKKKIKFEVIKKKNYTRKERYIVIGKQSTLDHLYLYSISLCVRFGHKKVENWHHKDIISGNYTKYIF